MKMNCQIILVILLTMGISYLTGFWVSTHTWSKTVKKSEVCVELMEQDRQIWMTSMLKQGETIRKEVLENERLTQELIRTQDILTHTWDYQFMCKLVQCEAGGSDEETKLKVASVILNRVKDHRFPDTLIDVISQPGQFTPVSEGEAYEAEVDETVIHAVDMAILKDYSDGSLFFINHDLVNDTRYYDEKLTMVSRDDNGMRYYKHKE